MRTVNNILLLLIAVFLFSDTVYSEQGRLRVPVQSKTAEGRKRLLGSAEILTDAVPLDLARGAADGKLASGENIKQPSNETAETVSIEVMPNGYAFTRHLDAKSRIWKTSNGEPELIAVLYIDDKTEAGFYGATIMPDGNLFTQDLDGRFRAWDMKGNLICSLTKEEVNAAGIYSADGINNSEVTVARDFGGRYRVFHKDDADPTEVEVRLIANLHGVFKKNIKIGAKMVRVLADGNIFTRDSDDKCRIWDSEGKHIATLSKLGFVLQVGHYGAEVLPDSRILTLDGDSKFRIWNSKGEFIAVLSTDKLDDGGNIASILSNGDIVIRNLFGEVKIYNPKGEVIAILFSINKKFNVKIGQYSIRKLPDGEILTHDSDSKIRIWNIAGKLIGTLQAYAPLYTAHYSVNVLSNRRMLTLDYDHRFRIWDDRGDLLTVLSIDGNDTRFHSGNVLPDGNILTLTKDLTYVIWDNEGRIITTLSIDGIPVKFNSGNILWDGNILTRGVDNVHRIWDSKGNLVTALSLDGSVVEFDTANILPDGNILARNSDDTYIVWNSRGEVIARFSLLTDGVKSGSHSYEVLRDGNVLTVDLRDNRQRIWNISIHIKKQQESASESRGAGGEKLASNSANLSDAMGARDSQTGDYADTGIFDQAARNSIFGLETQRAGFLWRDNILVAPKLDEGLLNRPGARYYLWTGVELKYFIAAKDVKRLGLSKGINGKLIPRYIDATGVLRGGDPDPQKIGPDNKEAGLIRNLARRLSIGVPFYVIAYIPGETAGDAPLLTENSTSFDINGKKTNVTRLADMPIFTLGLFKSPAHVVIVGAKMAHEQTAYEARIKGRNGLEQHIAGLEAERGVLEAYLTSLGYLLKPGDISKNIFTNEIGRAITEVRERLKEAHLALESGKKTKGDDYSDGAAIQAKTPGVTIRDFAELARYLIAGEGEDRKDVKSLRLTKNGVEYEYTDENLYSETWEVLMRDKGTKRRIILDALRRHIIRSGQNIVVILENFSLNVAITTLRDVLIQSTKDTLIPSQLEEGVMYLAETQGQSLASNETVSRGAAGQTKDYNPKETKAKITEIAVRLMSNKYTPGSSNDPESDIDTLIELAVLTVNDPTIEKSVVAALETVVKGHKKEGGNADIRNMAAEALELLRRRPVNAASNDIRANSRAIDTGL